MNSSRVTAVASIIIATAVVLGILALGRVVLVPIALSLVFAAVLRPVIRRMEGWRLPAPLGSAVLLLGVLGLVTAGGAALAEPARAWMARAPVAAVAAGKKIAALRHSFDRLGGVLLPVADSGASRPVSADSTAPAPQQINATPSPQGPSLGPFLSKAFGTTTEIIGGMISMLLLLYFLLAGGSTWSERMRKAAPSPEAGDRAVAIVEEIQRVISRYFFATLLINLGQGLLVGLAMAAVGMPAPLLWGMLTVIAEFIPYAGGFAMVILLGLVGLSRSDSVGSALLAPGLYLLITTLQNNLVSPIVYGKGLKLHPVPILIAVIFGYFIWGVPGAFLAVPMLAAVKILSGEFRSLKGIGTFVAD